MRKILVPPLLLVLCLIGMIVVSRYGPSTIWFEQPFDKAGWAIVTLGVLLPIWAARIFKRRETNILPYRDPEKIVTEGPFKFTRNPMYLGMLLVLIGTAVKLGTLESFGFVLLFFGVANWWYIPFEEARMHAVFGEQFDTYKSVVRRWL
ncbi:MAG: isoprenylcysteine carboxylmethyltransferase family protein [Kordiimonadaceae bacterium]|nr:isoprenylcysteine carboxylmethyltransferase family protein [Kordiimonadaceae bacterium]MBO6569953.1 isoprenylcysteine carboxylmethyltransferase family protein [Kordiimonadaceae bacterium]MBO6965950.1 isoprenylcysteine carboxylmethyltransferase family protein [Kordiimonadaceae bacterium]